MTAIEWVGVSFVGLLLLYVVVRMVGMAWYKARRDHLLEMSKLFSTSATKVKRTPVSKPGEENGH